MAGAQLAAAQLAAELLVAALLAVALLAAALREQALRVLDPARREANRRTNTHHLIAPWLFPLPPSPLVSLQRHGCPLLLLLLLPPLLPVQQRHKYPSWLVLLQVMPPARQCRCSPPPLPVRDRQASWRPNTDRQE